MYTGAIRSANHGLSQLAAAGDLCNWRCTAERPWFASRRLCPAASVAASLGYSYHRGATRVSRRKRAARLRTTAPHELAQQSRWHYVCQWEYSVAVWVLVGTRSRNRATTRASQVILRQCMQPRRAAPRRAERRFHLNFPFDHNSGEGSLTAGNHRGEPPAASRHFLRGSASSIVPHGHLVLSALPQEQSRLLWQQRMPTVGRPASTSGCREPMPCHATPRHATPRHAVPAMPRGGGGSGSPSG